MLYQEQRPLPVNWSANRRVPFSELFVLGLMNDLQAAQNPTSLNARVIVHTVKSLVDTSTSPVNLMKMTEIFVPWF